MVTESTLLAALWGGPADTAEGRVRASLAAGTLRLTGSFRGREREVIGAAKVCRPGDDTPGRTQH